jgi:molybdopterin-guanine dinucleotide biosynthesis protein A
LGDDIILIANDPAPYAFLKLPIVPDQQPNYGPLMGLYSGLVVARHELVLLVACDMPFLSTPLLAHMLEMAGQGDVVIPTTSDGQHPLHAVYRRSTCLPAITQAIALGKRRMIAFHDQVKVVEIGDDALRRFDPGGLALLNVNTPEDLALAEHVARRAYVEEEL